MKIAKSRAQVSSQTTLSRASSPHGAPTVGRDPYFQGANILTDPGFENFVANSGGWHWPSRPKMLETYLLPKLNITCPSYMMWPDLTCTDETLVGWFQVTGPYESDGSKEDQGWKVSVHDPHTGDYHAVWWEWNNGGIPPGELGVISPFIDAPFSARVNPGDTVTWSGYAKVDSITGTPQMFLVIRFYAPNFSIIGGYQSTTSSLTTTYTQYSVSGVAPSGTHYIRAYFAFVGSGNDSWVAIDTASLGVE